MGGGALIRVHGHESLFLPEWSLGSARQLDGLGDLGVEEMEVVDLGESSGVVDAGLGDLLLKVAVRLDGICGRSQVGIDGVCTTSGLGVLQLHVLAGTRNRGA